MAWETGITARIDLNYGPYLDYSEDEFVMPGPGAISGISKCFTSPTENVISAMCDAQESEFERLGLEFKSLWGRRLRWIDLQNLSCECDKLARIKHPEAVGNGRTKIKQIFTPTAKPINYFFPPKWKLRINT